MCLAWPESRVTSAPRHGWGRGHKYFLDNLLFGVKEGMLYALKIHPTDDLDVGLDVMLWIAY